MRNTAGAIAMAIAVTGMFGTASTVAYADQEGTVNTSVLNVRSGPSTSNSCVGTVKLNTKVTILGTENGWYKISFNGTTAYVSSQYVSTSGTNSGNSTTAAGTGKVNGGPLNVRTGAGTNYNTLGTVPVGTSVNVLGTENGWYKVNVTVNGQTVTGYVKTDYVTMNGGSSENNSSSTGNNTTPASGTATCQYALNLRSGAGTNSNIVTVLSEGTKVTINSASGQWYNVTATVNGKTVTGYLYATYLTVDNNSGNSSNNSNNANNNNTQSAQGQCKVTADFLNLRKEANTSCTVLGTVKAGDILTITGTSGSWYQVTATVNGKTVTGYVYSEYVQKVDSNSNAGNSNNNNNAATEEKSGTVTSGPLNVRQSASMNGAVLGTVTKGTKVTVLGTEGNFYKVKVTVNGREVTAYVSTSYVSIGGSSDTTDDDNKDNTNTTDDGYTTVNETVWATEGVYVRSGPGTNYQYLTILSKGSAVKRIAIGNNGWSKVKYGNSEGYMKSEYLTTTNPNPSSNSTTRDELVAFAMQYLGYPYVWGGNNLETGVDCSGFTQQVYLKFGITLNRVADSQRANGISISREEAQPGDLFFYGSNGYATHVAIYIGDNKVIHASSPSVGIIISPANYKTPMQINRVLNE